MIIVGVFDLDNDVDEDLEKYHRLNRNNPPPYPQGQDMDVASKKLFESSDIDNVFKESVDRYANDVTRNNNLPHPSYPAYQYRPYGNILNNGYNNFSYPSAMYTQMNNMQRISGNTGLTYEKVDEVTAKATKGIIEILTTLGKVTPLYWYGTVLTAAKVGVPVFLIGLTLICFGVKVGINAIVAGILLMGVGMGMAFILKDKSLQYDSEYKETEPKINNTVQQMNNAQLLMLNDQYQQGLETIDITEFDKLPDDTERYDIDEDEEEYCLDIEEINKEFQKRVDYSIDNTAEVKNGMYTRQYLYEMFTKALPRLEPDFSLLREIDDEESAFIQMEVSLREAVEVTGCKGEVNLLSMHINMSTIVLKCDRPVGLKIDAVAEELARIYAKRSNAKDITKVYANADVEGRILHITIYTGETKMVSLHDMMLQVKDVILDSDNYMPVILGIDPKANVLVYDFKKLESVIITGMPRSGKSWFVQAVLTQMCAFVPPSELHIYICDPKDGISDFKSFCLPQVKKFVSGDANIIETLREVVKEEAVRRKDVIGGAGYVNIWDYKQDYPDVDLPIIYVVIDEVVTLAERMEKEIKQEFQGLLVELISQLPALGIRAFLIPHVIKNDIIAKTATDLVPCKISVCGDAEHIEKATGSKTKDFPYKLVNKGDMAVRMPAVSPSTMFIHGPALTTSNNDNKRLFDYMKRVWNKIEKGTEVSIDDLELDYYIET